ncbi:MAG: hypothetical protein M3Z37_03375 [Candidatus Eremiobacteraeota bacterium]|nr:hypothetical protein [Candidatus Eremiobacteraeota bacterium]
MFLAALSVAAALAVAPPDGTYSFSIEQTSVSIGTTTVTVKRADAGVQIHEKQDLKMNATSRSYAVDETLDAASLAPRTYVGTYSQDGSPAVFRMAFDAAGARASVDGVNGVTAVVMPPGTKAAFIAELSLMSGYLFLPAQVSAARVTKFAAVVPSELDAIVNHVETNMNPSRPSGIPPQDVPLSISGGAMSYDEWYDPLSFVVHAVTFSNGVIRLTHYSAEVRA